MYDADDDNRGVTRPDSAVKDAFDCRTLWLAASFGLRDLGSRARDKTLGASLRRCWKMTENERERERERERDSKRGSEGDTDRDRERTQ